jgi:hypothetical protein
MHRIICAILLLIGVTTSPAHAQGPAFLATGINVSLRSAPSIMAGRGGLLRQGETYSVIGRTDDNTWVAIQSADGAQRGWLPAGFGQISGNLETLPAQRPALAAMPRAGAAPLPVWIKPTVRGKTLFAAAIKAGRDPRIFTIAGDSNSAWAKSLGRVSSGLFDLSGDRRYAPVLARWDVSFARQSVAVGGGYRAADMFLPEMADPRCPASEPMFVCEIRRSRASIVFIQLGTGDKFEWAGFEQNLLKMVDHALRNNTLPVLVTKADDLESIQGGGPLNHINDTIRRVAETQQLPLIDFYAATRTLPSVPNPELPKRPFTQYGLHDEWGYYFHLTDQGHELRIVCTLQMLDALGR